MIGKTEEEIKQIAKDLFHGKIFCDRHINEAIYVEKVFAVIALDGFNNFSKEEIQDIGMIYEYFDAASPIKFNGYPVFFSARYLNKNDTRKVFAYYETLKEFEASL